MAFKERKYFQLIYQCLSRFYERAARNLSFRCAHFNMLRNTYPNNFNNVVYLNHSDKLIRGYIDWSFHSNRGLFSFPWWPFDTIMIYIVTFVTFIRVYEGRRYRFVKFGPGPWKFREFVCKHLSNVITPTFVSRRLLCCIALRVRVYKFLPMKTLLAVTFY